MSKNFLGDLDFGKEGEKVVEEILNKRTDALKVLNEKGLDLRDDTTWQKIEVKSDRWTLRTGNICLELWSQVEMRSEGWFQHSPAEVLAYVLYDQKGYKAETVLFYNFIGLRDFIYWNILKGDWNYDNPSLGKITNAKWGGAKNARNLLVPQDKIKLFLLESITL